MKIEKLVNRINNNIQSIYKELNIKRNEIEFDIIIKEECDDSRDVAYVVGGLKYNESFKLFTYIYDGIIHIQSKAINEACDIIYNFYLGVYSDKNEKLLENIFIILLENYIIHELRHIFQFKSLVFNINDIDVKDNIPKEKIVLKMEEDAINYSLLKTNITILNDIKLKELVSFADYYLKLFEMYNTEKYETNAVNYLCLLTDYIIEKYNVKINLERDVSND